MTESESGTEASRASREERLAIVEEHTQQKNQHNLDGIMATFGEDVWYDDEPIGEHHEGRDNVRAYYADLLHALPDFHIDVNRRHETDDHVNLEVTISGTHEGNWRGLPGTGREVEWDTCAVFAFDDQNKLAGERIYYDRASLLRQLGIFHEPEQGIGQVLTPLLHPVTFGRALARNILGERLHRVPFGRETQPMCRSITARPPIDKVIGAFARCIHHSTHAGLDELRPATDTESLRSGSDRSHCS